MSFDGRGKLSWEMAVLAVAYLFRLPAYLLASLLYNFFVRPAKHRRWKEKFMCQRCGVPIEALTVKPRRFTSGLFRGAASLKRKWDPVSRGIMVQ